MSLSRTPSPERKKGGVDVKEMLNYCKRVYLSSLSEKERNQLQILEQTIVDLKNKSEVIHNELNQKRNENLREILNGVIGRYKLFLLSENVRSNISELIRKKGGEDFLKYLDDQRFNMSVPWESLQVSYFNLIKDYISEQQSSMTVEPLKIKLTKQFLHEFLMEFLKNQMSQQAFKSKQESAGEITNHLDFLSSEILTVFVAEQKHDSDQGKKRVAEYLNKLSNNNQIDKADKMIVMKFINLLDEYYPTYDKFENKLKEFRMHLNPQETNLYIFLPEFEKNKVPYQKHLKTLLELEETTKSSLEKKIVPVINSLRDFITNRLSSEENRFISMIQQFNFLSENDKQYIIELANLISNVGHDKEKKEIEEKDIILSKLIKLDGVANKQELLDELKKIIDYHSEVTLRVHKEVLAELSQRFGVNEEIALANTQSEIHRLQNLSLIEQNKEMAHTDKMLLDILRSQVLHAAKIYFVDVKTDEGFFHKRNHKDEKNERETVADLIKPLLSQDIHSFGESLELVERILDKRPGGLHQNSFATILLAVLYNEGEPKGLFKTNESDAAKFKSPDISYKGYPPSASALHDPIEYLTNSYFPPSNAKIEGKLVNNLRGKKALFDSDLGRLSPEKKIPILEEAKTNFLEIKNKLSDYIPKAAMVSQSSGPAR